MFTTKKVIDLNVGDLVYIYGTRRVIDVHNLHTSYGDNVRLVTSDGTFLVDKNLCLEIKP